MCLQKDIYNGLVHRPFKIREKEKRNKKDGLFLLFSFDFFEEKIEKNPKGKKGIKEGVEKAKKRKRQKERNKLTKKEEEKKEKTKKDLQRFLKATILFLLQDSIQIKDLN